MCVTFLTGSTLQVSLGTVLTAVAGPPLLLKQLVNTLDDALQRLIHIQPNLLLKGHGHKTMHSIFESYVRKVKWLMDKLQQGKESSQRGEKMHKR